MYLHTYIHSYICIYIYLYLCIYHASWTVDPLPQTRQTHQTLTLPLALRLGSISLKLTTMCICKKPQGSFKGAIEWWPRLGSCSYDPLPLISIAREHHDVFMIQVYYTKALKTRVPEGSSSGKVYAATRELNAVWHSVRSYGRTYIKLFKSCQRKQQLYPAPKTHTKCAYNALGLLPAGTV